MSKVFYKKKMRIVYVLIGGYVTINQLFPFYLVELDVGLKYLGFQLKANMYKRGTSNG